VALLLAAWATSWTCSAAMAQDAAADDAKALLKLGSTQYKEMDFKKAQESLLKVNADKLGDAEKSELNTLLANVKDAIKAQQAAQDTLNQAQKAETDGDLAKAIPLYEQVSKSSYLPETVRRDALAQATLLKSRLAKTTKPAPYPLPETAAATRPAANPAVKPVMAPPARPEVKTLPAPAASDQQARLAKVNDLMQRGNAALEAGQADMAVASFEQALALAPENAKAKEQLDSARSIQAAGGAASPLGRLAQMQAVRRQEADLRIAQSIQRANEALAKPAKQEDFARAREDVSQAQLVLNTNKSVYSDDEFRAKKAELDQLAEYVESRQESFNRTRASQEAKEIATARLTHEAEVQRRKQQATDEMRRSLVSLRDQGRYADAVEVAGRLKQLDPGDGWATEQYAVLSQFLLLMEDKRAKGDSDREETKEFIAVREAAIPWYELLNYPRDWAEITLRRQGASAGEAAESEANRATRRKMSAVLPKLEFSGISFNDVVQFLRDVSSTNIYVKWPALQAAGIDKNTAVNIRLQDVSFEKALKTVLEDVGGATNNLDYIIDEGVIKISTREDLDKETVTKVYDIRDLIVRRPNFIGPSIDLTSFGCNTGNNCSSGSGMFGNNTTSGGGGGGNNGGGNCSVEATISRQELITSILELIRSTISPETWRENSGTIGSLREMQGMLVVTQTAKNQRSLTDLLNQLREAQALQINIEARFVTVQTGFLNRIGIDFDVFFNMGSTLKPVTTGTGAWSTDPLTGAKIVNPAGGTAFLPQWQGQGSPTNTTTVLPVHLGSYEFTQPTGTSVSNSIGTAATGVNAFNIGGTFLDDIQVDFLLTATQANTTTRTLTAPRVTIYNAQRAFVTVATEQAYVANRNPIVSENVVGYQPVIATVASGSVLDVEGTVSADKRYVNMTIQPTVSTINGFTEYQGAVDANGTPIPGSGTIQLPNITIQQLKCSVCVPDGGTLLLGGQRLAGESEKEMGVPLISKIPVLNRLTSNRSLVRDEQSLLILVKPKIIIQREYEEAAFPP
jgi:general secretion pathway protein D